MTGSIIKFVFRRLRKFVRILTGKDVFYRIQIKCPKERHGTIYGGWVICPTGVNKDTIVYSFGLGEDISFDLSLINRYGLKVYGFDPTPRSIKWIKSQNLPKEFVLFEIGLADYDGIAFFKPPDNPEHVSCTMLDRPSTEDMKIEVKVERLKTILGHLNHKKIDILKMNIEGAEYKAIEDFVKSDIDIGQVLVQFHHGSDKITVAETKKAVELLKGFGYQIFAISSTGCEYSFIKMKS